ATLWRAWARIACSDACPGANVRSASRFSRAESSLRPLLTLSARWMALSAAVVLALGVGAGAVRILPWLVSPDIPWATALPFAEELWQRASEVALVVGLPVGAATAAALFVESGGARSLMALGASPWKLALSVGHVGLLCVVAGAALGSARLGGDSPGHFASRLIQTGRSACERDSNTTRADVPFVGVAWLCFPEAPRLAGRVPG